jgi:hypothetical protein
MRIRKSGKQHQDAAKKSSKNSISQVALSVPAGGVIHARVYAVALPDNGAPPHTQLLDQTWDIPAGSHKYGNPSDGVIVAQGYPHNGGSHSWEYLLSECNITEQNSSPATVQLRLTAISDLNSGVGRGTGASSDFDTEWFVIRGLPPGKPWTVQAIGVINASGVTPTCSIRVNNDRPRPIKPGPFIETFDNLSGTIAIFVSISQGHLAIFPSGPIPGASRITIVSDVTLSFIRA